MADLGNQDMVADNVSDISSYSESDSEARKIVEVVEETIEEYDKPAYSDEDLNTLVGFISNMVLLFDYDRNDFGDDAASVVKQWLIDSNYPMMFIFYDGDILSASLAFPLCPFNDLMYFMREPDQLFNVIEQFHDDIIFGTLHNDIEGSLLVTLEQVYGPLILANTEWSEDVKAQVISGYNTFMAYLTELHYKLSGFTLLYVPCEGHNMQVQEVAVNRSMVKRLETVVIDWTSQIRSTLSDTQHFVPDDLIRPSDEYNFWLYRHEVLCAMKSQFEGANIQHILKILELAQSLYTKPLRDVFSSLTEEIQIAESNIPFLKLMVEPCFAIRSLESEDDLCLQLVHVMHMLRFIGSNSCNLREDDCITKLFLYLSNEIVSSCMQCIDVDKILSGSPKHGIEICGLKINCCEFYKIIYEEMLEQYKHEFNWNLDYAVIFNKINAFIQRLSDILEICEAMLIFGKHTDSNSYKNNRFSCNNAKEFEKKCDKVEQIFTGGIEIILSTSGSILDINDKGWYKYIADFREMLRTLDDIIENLLSNVFLVSENLEEKIDALITLLIFYNRESIKESFMRKIAEIWHIFHTEITDLSKEVSSGIILYPTFLPPNVGQYTMLKIKFQHLYRLKELLERCRFFPQYLESEDTLALFESCEKQVKTALKGFNDAWIKSITSDFGTWLNRNLVCRSQMRPGLLECHIERSMLLTIDEAHFFMVQGAIIPSVIDMEKNQSVKQTFDSVIRIVLYFNNVISSVSAKERIFFKHMIQQTERKLEPLKSKLTWNEDLGEFIDTFVINVKELLDVIQVYKRENLKIANWMESIFNLYLFELNKLHAQTLKDFFKNIGEQKKKSITELVNLLSEISKNIFCIFERLGSNVRRMEESWSQYVQKIDTILKASIFNSSLETLKCIQKALTDTDYPILSVEIVLDENGITYKPTLESIETAMKRLSMEVPSILKLIPSMCQKFQINSDENFLTDFLQNSAYQDINSSICQAIANAMLELRTFKEKWSVFRPFWSINRTAFIDKFKLSAMSSDAFHRNIEKFEELLNQLSTQNDVTVCKCVEVNALKLKSAITNHINDWQIKYIEYLKCISYGLIIEFNNTLNNNMEALSYEPKEVEDLKKLESTYQNCYDAIPNMIEDIKVIVKYFGVLERYTSDLLPEANHLFQNIHNIWERYMDHITNIKDQIENYQSQFKLSMTSEVASLKVNALEMLKLLDMQMPVDCDILPEDAFLTIDNLMVQLEQLEAQENIIRDKMRLLGVEYHPLEAIIQIRKKLECMKLIWIFMCKWKHIKEITLVQIFQEISVNEIHEYIMNIICELRTLESEITEDMKYPIYYSTRADVLNFEITVSILIEMKSSYLRVRHWSAIKNILSQQFNHTENFSLGSMIEYNFFLHEEKLNTLCCAARKEHDIEMELEIIEQVSEQIDYRMKRNHAAYKITNAKICFSIIESNSLRIHRIQQSVHSLPFQETINYWEETLNLMKDLLDCLLVIEEKHNLLEDIYKMTVSSEKLEHFNHAFSLCQKDWTTIGQLISNENLRSEICPKGLPFLDKVETLRKRFENLFQHLNEMMDSKRKCCARLYLISDRLLIKLIAGPLDFELLNQAIKLIFENFSSLCTRRQNLPPRNSRWEILGVCTKHKECVTFLKPYVLETNTNIDQIINEIEQSVRESLKNALRGCLLQLKQNYFKRVECGWLNAWLHQLCLKSTSIENTLHIRNALLQSDLLGKTKPMKMLRKMHNKLLNELTVSSRNLTSIDENVWLSKKLDDMIIIEINARDVINHFSDQKVMDLKNFEWLSQLRSYWNDQTNTCSIVHIDNTIPYGYECKSSSQPLFMNIHTNRIIMAVTCAMKSKFVPYLLGEDENRSVGLLKNLSTELAVFFAVLYCDREWKAEPVIRYLTGILEMRAWICFSAIEKLPSQILATINGIIKKSSSKKSNSQILELKKPRSYSNFQIFVTGSDRVKVVTELERSVIRPIAVVSPDEEIMLQNMLCYCGVNHYRTIARLIKLFVKHLKLHLYNRYQLWTRQRIWNAILRTKTLLRQNSCSETDVVASALREEFAPSLSDNENKLFEQWMSSIFPMIKNENHISDMDSDQKLKSAFDELQLTSTPYQESKVKEILMKLSQNRLLIVTGEPVSGKSHLLKAALLTLRNNDQCYQQYYINPETLKLPTNNQSLNRSQFDEILTTIMESKKHIRKCILFDCAELLDSWVKCIESLPNQFITNDLTNVSCVASDLKIVIEIVDLGKATPSSIINFGIVHIDEKQLSWKQSFITWLTFSTFMADDVKNYLKELGNTYLEVFFKLFKTNINFYTETNDINAMQMFCHIYTTIFQNWKTNKLLVGEYMTKEALRKLFFFCCIWSVGASLNETNREKLDILIREQISDSASSLPLKGNIFDYFVEVTENSSSWVTWNTQHLENAGNDFSFGDYVYTKENISYQYITALMMMDVKPVLITSESTVGKSAMIKHLVTSRNAENQLNCFTNLTKITSACCLRRILSKHSINVAKEIVYPKDRKKLLWILDDFHTVLENNTDSMEFLKTLIEHKFWYHDRCPQHLKNTAIVAAMKNILHVSRFTSSVRRLLNKFNIIYYATNSDENKAFIFTEKIKTMMHSDKSNKILDSLAPATVELIRCLATSMPPTPNNPRYQFSMKTVGRILNAFCQLSIKTTLSDKTSLLRFWIHECYRETYDLLRASDHKKYFEIFNDTISTYFEATLHGICPRNRSPVFCDMKTADSKYEDVAEIEQLIQLTEEAAQIHFATESVPIVHKAAVEHAAKLLRILQIENGHIILSGDAGSGRSTVCQIAMSMYNFQKTDTRDNILLHHLRIKLIDDAEAIDRKFTKLFIRCMSSRVLCLIQVHQPEKTNQSMLEIVNSIILNGTIDGFYPCSDSLHNFPENFIWTDVRLNLHFVLCIPDSSEHYRLLSNAFPSLCTSVTTNCMQSLSNESLTEITKKFLQRNVIFDIPILGPDNSVSVQRKQQYRKRDSLIQSTEERLLLATVDAIPRVHLSAKHDMVSSQARTSVLCSWYFEMLLTFERILVLKRSNLSNEYRKFHIGIEQIIDATQNVTLLQERLEKQQEQIGIYQLELEQFIESINLQTAEADEQSQEVSVQREKIGAEEILCKQLADDAGADLEKAMPALNNAIAALDSLNKKDMNEIKSYARPPVKVELVLNAVMILLGKEPTWTEAKRQLGEQKFLDTLKNLDRNHISDKTLKTIGGYVRNPDLEPNKVGIVSKAAKSLMMWVRAIENYGKVYKYVGPKIRKMEEAEASLLEKQNSLRRAEQKLADLAAQLDALHLEYANKMKCKDELDEAARQMSLKLERSKALVEGLASERVKWTNSAECLEHEYSCLIGNALLAAGSLVYFGSLPSALREQLRTQWKIDLEALEILFTENFVLFNQLYHPDVLEVWQSNGLATDDLSIENTTILLNSIRLPLAVDPQNEIYRWILNQYNASGILQRDFDEDIPEAFIATTIRDRIPLLLYNFKSSSIHDVNDLEKIFFWIQQFNISHNDQDSSGINDKSRSVLFMTTYENLILDFRSSKVVNMVNFVFGLSGLETKLLAFVVEHENPALEERKETIIRTIAENKTTLVKLEDNILLILNERKVPLLENEQLYGTLNVSKQASSDLNKGLKLAEQAKKDIEISRGTYKPCAKRAALLFFVLNTMKRFNSFYWFSLDWYFSLFLQSLEKSGRSQIIDERKTKINEYHTYHVFKNVCLGLNRMDQEIFGFYLTISLLYANDEFNDREFRYLLYGAGKIDRVEQVENPNPEWISHVQWDNITELDKLPGFRGLIQSFEEVNDDWKSWYMSPSSEVKRLPANWERNLTKFQKYLVVRSLRLDRLEYCLNEFVGCYLGRKYSDSPHFTINDIFNQSVARTPIMLIASSHGNPWRDVLCLAHSNFANPDENVLYLNANTVSIETIINNLKISVKQEKWLFVNDCHKSKRLLSQLAHVLNFLNQINSNSKFRLWIVIDVNCSYVPVNVVKDCTKFMYNETMGIRQRMHSLYEVIGESRFKKKSKNKYHIQLKKILYSMTFFHALLIERKKFQTLGWMKQYFLNSLDFQLSEKLLDFGMLELVPTNLNKKIVDQNVETEHEFEEIIPWQFIKSICLEVAYGNKTNCFGTVSNTSCLPGSS
ncbi:dynein axonemal heavy chain 2-like isoform X2 [Malaya genurostris]|uniref:dynein axonemal heavy chain 2-like isoform X2 n=1 Tax=Malaya genurostris TaxID=325434 RepID=UPI0026F3C45F|nr:dynein axonemal heavy chain 2-like isoform X2 [Malaya genurostris]